ncbi:MAG: uroporphyrinogen decarboxylase family protein [Negativicutes bacterium]|nr:uroporphyrinogen decarboxylase family protein [Negativicutes bacterium]
MPTYRERMLATLRGEPTDCLPCVPRLDLWYKANKWKGTLPTKYRNASLRDIVEDLDVGYHTVVPDFHLYDDPLDIVDRALGIWRVHTMPYRAKLRNIKRNIVYSGDATHVEYLTPAGMITTTAVYDDSMRQAGITLSHVAEKAIKSADDYEALGYIFENAEVWPSYDRLLEFKDHVGDRGLICGTANQGASPMHEILHELIAYDLFFYEVYDHPAELKRLAERMTPYYNKVLDAAINSPADYVMVGSNYDLQITWPAFMAEHVAPFLAAASDRLHAAGKFLLTHTDGENKKLLPYYLEGRLDIADSICPAPMTALTLGEIKETFAGKVTIWGGIPSVAVLENSMSEYEFEAYIDDLFRQMGRGDHLILSIADTAPPEMKFSRLERIIKKAREFGPVRP